MSLTTSQRNRIIDEMNVSFDAVGTKVPRGSKSNTASAAWEYFAASHLLARAKARLDDAKEIAIEAGVIFDHLKSPAEPGKHDVYKDDNVFVTLLVKNPSKRIDAQKMHDYLKHKGVDVAILKDALDFATSIAERGAHEFKVDLIQPLT